MIEELISSEFEKVRSIYINNNQQLPVFSIINGNHPGRIFVDDRDNPKAAITWAIGRWAYIDGSVDNIEFNSSIPELIKKTVIPDSKEKLRMDWFELYACGNPKWETVIDNSVKQFDSSKHFESVYTWDNQKYFKFRQDYKRPGGVAIKKLNVPLLSEKAQKSSLVPKKYWNKTTFGFAVMSKGEELTLCRSTGFEVGDIFMVDVITHDADYRRKGYATMSCVALLDFCIKNDLVPLWETTENNIGSQRLANKLGFVKDQIYPVYAIEF